MAKLRAVYYINQFYAGMGGEEMADTGLHILNEKKGPALLNQCGRTRWKL